MAVSSGVYAKAPDGDDSPTAQEIIARLENAEDPQQEFAQLSPLEQQAATEALRAATLEVVKVSTTSGVGGASGSCGTNSATVTGKSIILNRTLFTYTTRTEWCWNGTEITNTPFFTVDHDVIAPLWEFAGNTERSESGGRGDWVHRDYEEGHFRLCVGGNVGCVQHKYPDVSKRQYGDGSFKAW